MPKSGALPVAAAPSSLVPHCSPGITSAEMRSPRSRLFWLKFSICFAQTSPSEAVSVCQGTIPKTDWGWTGAARAGRAGRATRQQPGGGEGDAETAPAPGWANAGITHNRLPAPGQRVHLVVDAKVTEAGDAVAVPGDEADRRLEPGPAHILLPE